MVLSAQQKAALMKAVHLAILGWTLEAVLQKDWGARDLDAAEVFTTAQAVVAAARLGGYRAEAYDINLPGGRGIQEEAGFLQAVQLVMRVQPGGLVTLAPCCKSFGFAPRRWTGRTLRQIEGDVGYPGVVLGNIMARAAMFLFCLAVLRDLEVVLENPAGSMMFRLLSNTIAALEPYGLVHYFYLPCCAYDVETPEPRWLKRFKFLSSGAWLRRAVRPCTCKGPHRPLMDTVILADGSVQKNGRRTEMEESGRYPLGLGHALVDAWAARTRPTVSASPAVSAAPASPALAVPAVQQSSSLEALEVDPWADSGLAADDPWATEGSRRVRRRVARGRRRIGSGEGGLAGEHDPWG